MFTEVKEHASETNNQPIGQTTSTSTFKCNIYYVVCEKRKKKKIYYLAICCLKQVKHQTVNIKE